MREILFRGKRLDNGEWAESEYPYGTMSCGVVRHDFDHNTIGQYTGLTDKCGTKIFEGDIVRYNDTIHKVIFCTINGSAFFGITMPDRGEIWNFDGITCANKMEVIGNIHDDPELIGGTNNA